jgi:hypothetical protein
MADSYESETNCEENARISFPKQLETLRLALREERETS